MYLKLDESKWYRHTQEWSDRTKGTGKVEVYKGQIEVVENVAPVVHAHKVCAHSQGGGTHWIVCSNCEKPIDWQDAYCKHCGAQMDEGVK